MTGFLVVIVALGWVLSQIYGDVSFLYVAIALSLFMNVTAYWFSDKVALASQYIKARLAEDNDTVLSLVADDIVLVSQK